MKLNFQQDVLVLPADILLRCANADAASLRVLLWLSSDLSLSKKVNQLAKLADCDVNTVKKAISYWQAEGILIDSAKAAALSVMSTAVESVSKDVPELQEASDVVSPSKPLLRRADELPNYSSSELAALMEQREGMRTLVDEAQRVFGKMFNYSEINILVGMTDYLGMSEECILLLLEHCRKSEMKSIRAVEKYAYKLVEKGVCSLEQMEEEIHISEELHSFVGQIRTLFGIGKRTLTSKENKMVSAWLSFGYDIEIVRMAYEITVNATGEASIPYANSILERWNSEGLKTLEQIRTYIEQEKAKKNSKVKEKNELGKSFDTDDFFEAALRRSFKNTPNA